MSTVITQLLDTPKRMSLQEQSTQIRATLKDYERTFAAENGGRKPSKDDIRLDAVIAVKYKEYSRIRDVLAGKLDYDLLADPQRSPAKRRRHERDQNGVGQISRKQIYSDTPRRQSRHSQVDLEEADESGGQQLAMLSAIGPTPQRDGKILGLFDLLSNSAHSSKGTPSSRKRKLDALVEESPNKPVPTQTAQTPSRPKTHIQGDLLEHLTGSPAPTPETGHRKLSRTPISEGRKFMLSQFFATPSTSRYSNPGLDKDPTPLRDRVLGFTPDDKAQPAQQAPDATPAYLRRSTSFKDRLLSASQPNRVGGLMSPPVTRAGPPTLQHFRSVSSLFSDFHSKFSDINEEDPEDDLDDDLEALREMEASELNVLVKDSQRKEREAVVEVSNPQRTWKKRGQKRTTRKVKMRPAVAVSAQAPKFVAADGGESDDDNDNDEDNEDLSQIRETQLYDGEVSDFEPDMGKKAKAKPLPHKNDKPRKKTATINPNATAHMNFRSLKIKNKNSKAKGKGRFGSARGRR